MATKTKKKPVKGAKAPKSTSTRSRAIAKAKAKSKTKSKVKVLPKAKVKAKPSAKAKAKGNTKGKPVMRKTTKSKTVSKAKPKAAKNAPTKSSRVSKSSTVKKATTTPKPSHKTTKVKSLKPVPVKKIAEKPAALATPKSVAKAAVSSAAEKLRKKEIIKQKAARLRRMKRFIPLLQERQKALLKAYHAAKGSSRDAESDGTEDYIDYAVSSYTREFSLSLTEMERKKLKLVEEALQRLKRNEFGACLNCSVDVPEMRLEVEPWARFCIRCQELDEHGLLDELAFSDDDDEETEDDDEDGDSDSPSKSTRGGDSFDSDSSDAANDG